MSKKKPKTDPSQANAARKQQSPFLRWLDSRQAEWILVGVIIIIAGILRFQNINSPVMWLDELAEVFCTNGYFYGNFDQYIPKDILIKDPKNPSSKENRKPVTHFVKEMAHFDAHPPFHYILFYIFRSVFGDSPPSLRILSILPSILSILLIYIIGKNLYGKIEGIGASLLMTLSTPQIIYAHEVRHYSFLIFLGLLTLLVYLLIIKKGPNWKLNAIFALLVFLLAFTHYFSIGFILALGVYSLITIRGKMLMALISSFITSACLFLMVWGYPFYLQFFSGSAKAIGALNYRHAPQATMNFLPTFLDTLPERYFFHLPFDYTIQRPSYFLFACLLPFVAVLWRRELLLPWFLFLFTTFFVVGLDLWRGTFHSINIRYTLLASPALYLIVAAGIFTGPRRLILNSIGIILFLAILLFNLPSAFKEYRDNWFEMSEIIRLNGSSTDAIILPHVGKNDQLYWPHFMWNSICYYNYQPNRPMVIATKPLTHDMVTEIGLGTNAWVITRIPEFPQSANLNWPSQWIPGCQVIGAWLLQDRATLFHLTLPKKIP